MNANELRERYQQFFEARRHKRIRSAPLLPENDPTVLFTTAGMHPLVPFLLGESHPLGQRLVNVQKCLRTDDIDEVGDTSHLTFFEMLGNWSLGDYFKKESLAWSYEFLTRDLALDPARLSVTVFAGDADAPRDDESAEVWRHLGIPNARIYFLPKKDNWWGPAGATGPCGPDSEIFYDTGKPDHPGCAPGCACGKWFEIWNNVFMAYNKTGDGRYEKLRQQNVDTGMGVDRTVAVLQGYDDVFRVETLRPLIEFLEELSHREYAPDPKPFRVIADHVRAATFAIADGATPSNVQAGYIVRRLIRRAVRYARDLGIAHSFCADLSGIVVNMFAPAYPELEQNRARIAEELEREETKFQATLARGLREYHKKVEHIQGKGENIISGADAFDLFETYGFPLPLTAELAREQGLGVDEIGFEALYQEHKELSRRSNEQKFKGGLADHAAETTRLHTATHLLHQALRQVLGASVHQMGSNITVERLRFDFSYAEKLTPEQISKVEEIVNAQIANDLPVSVEVMSLDQATGSGALAFFGEKYGDQVKVYAIGAFSKEVCGGPHVTRTGELGKFKITKQEAVGQGVRRVRAVLE
ncbi:MAG: alanine--tRNA ligase [Anaerolineales bacterium]|nr:alanine--tRNA ligase [Anaerolineales bacterium]